MSTAAQKSDPPPCTPANGRLGFPFGFLGAGGRLLKARRGRVCCAILLLLTAARIWLAKTIEIRSGFKNETKDSKHIQTMTNRGESVLGTKESRMHRRIFLILEFDYVAGSWWLEL